MQQKRVLHRSCVGSLSLILPAIVAIACSGSVTGDSSGGNGGGNAGNGGTRVTPPDPTPDQVVSNSLVRRLTQAEIASDRHELGG